MIVHLLLFDKPDRLRDIVEATDSDDTHMAGYLKMQGFDLQIDDTNPAYAEFKVMNDAGDQLGIFRVVPGGVPARCRKPRACITIKGQLVGVQEAMKAFATICAGQ